MEDRISKEQQHVSPEPISTVLIVHKMKGMDFDRIPDYLCQTNPSLEKNIHSILPSTLHLEELRDIAILIHKIMSIEIVSSLWIVYRKSGTGDLPSSTLSINPLDRKIWPKQVQALVQSSHRSSINQATAVDDDDVCLTFVNDCLHELTMNHEQYRHELHLKTSHLLGYTRTMEDRIEKFVQQGLLTQRLDIDHQMALVQYHYIDELLHRVHLAQNPNEHQMNIVQHLCQLKYEQERTKYEAKFLKQQIPIYIAAHPLEKHSIAQSSLIDRIRHPIMRQELYQHYQETAEQARMKMMTVYQKYAEAKRDQCQQQFDLAMKQLWEREKPLPLHQSWTPIMRQLIKEHFVNITARIDCIYQFKMQLSNLLTSSTIP